MNELKDLWNICERTRYFVTVAVRDQEEDERSTGAVRQKSNVSKCNDEIM